MEAPESGNLSKFTLSASSEGKDFNKVRLSRRRRSSTCGFLGQMCVQEDDRQSIQHRPWPESLLWVGESQVLRKPLMWQGEGRGRAHPRKEGNRKRWLNAEAKARRSRLSPVCLPAWEWEGRALLLYMEKRAAHCPVGPQCLIRMSSTR